MSEELIVGEMERAGSGVGQSVLRAANVGELVAVAVMPLVESGEAAEVRRGGVAGH